MSSKIVFNCDNCEQESSTWVAWFKKRKNHYCSRPCKDSHHKELYGSGLSRPEYEKQYWAKPENACRRKKMSKAAHRRRIESLGDSLKKAMVTRCKDRAIKRGIPFDLSHEDFDIPEKCPVLGCNFSIGEGQGGSKFSPSLDRIVPSLGYVRGNVMVISKRANMIKTDAAPEEIMAVAKFMMELSHPVDRQE